MLLSEMGITQENILKMWIYSTKILVHRRTEKITLAHTYWAPTICQALCQVQLDGTSPVWSQPQWNVFAGGEDKQKHANYKNITGAICLVVEHARAAHENSRSDGQAKGLPGGTLRLGPLRGGGVRQRMVKRRAFWGRRNCVERFSLGKRNWRNPVGQWYSEKGELWQKVRFYEK